MAIELAKETLCIGQMVGQKVENWIAETDSVVPDIKPDILNTINTNGTICVYKKEILDGKIKIEGSIQVYVAYLADDEQSNLRSLHTTVDFSKVIEMENAKEGMNLEENLRLKNIECKVLNGRKVNIKAMIEANVLVSANENIEFVKEIKEVKDVQMLNESLMINSLLGSGATKVYAKDTFIIQEVDDLSEIMKVNIAIKNKETKISYNKVLAKADTEVKIMYLTTDGRINKVEGTIPIMGFIDIQDVTEENLCETNYEVKNLLIKPNNIEEHSVYIEAEVELNCNVYETKQINVIQDLYSPSVNLNYKQKQINCLGQKKLAKDILHLTEKQYIEEIGNHKIHDVEVIPIISNQNIMKDKILYEGELELKWIFEAENSCKMDTKVTNIPFQYQMDCIGAKANSKVNTQMEIIMQDFVILPDQSIQSKIDIQFIAEISTKQSISVIDNISIEESKLEEKYSLVIYFVKPGDSLWKIAKKFRSTVEAIAKVNDIENENKINVGEQLFIPMTI